MPTARFFSITCLIAMALILRDISITPHSPVKRRLSTEANAQTTDEVESDESVRISARTVNRFHLALVGRVILAMPSNLSLTVVYDGIVASDRGNKALRIDGAIGLPLGWIVFDNDGIGVFSFQISSRRTNATACSCRLQQETVYIEVLGVDGPTKNDKLLNTARKQLGGRSIFEVIKLLESEPSRIEQRTK